MDIVANLADFVDETGI